MFSSFLVRDRAPILDRRGHPRSIVTLPEYRLGKPPANKGKTYPPEILTPDEIRRLIAACGNRGPSGLRNRALIVTMWRCGLRVAEALALYPKDVDRDAGTVTVLHGKGDYRRTVGIDPEALAVIALWLTDRKYLRLDGRHPLFCTISQPGAGRHIHSSYVRELLKDLAAKAGIEKRVHPHGLRHTHAYELAREGVPMPVIQKQLGHASLATTARYLDHFAPFEVISTMQARHWE